MPAKQQINAFSDTITTGIFKGERLLLPNNADQRPTRNRVRQAVFNMLESRLNFTGTRVLDACTGSGAWGLEALSRGAAQVVMIDVQTATAAANLNALGSPAQAQLVQADVVDYTPESPFDIILADPPYGTDIVQKMLARKDILGHTGSLWALEYGTAETYDFKGFKTLKIQTYGISSVALLEQL
jgi:16S rRNA (guanine966-N2)-methyltransferase